MEPLINGNENIVLLKQGHLASPLSYSLINDLGFVRASVFFTRIDKLSKEKAVEEIKSFFVLDGEIGLQISAISEEGILKL